MRTKDVVSCWSGESSKNRKDISLGNGVKIAGQEFSHGSENIVRNEATVCKHLKHKKRGVNSTTG